MDFYYEVICDYCGHKEPGVLKISPCADIDGPYQFSFRGHSGNFGFGGKGYKMSFSGFYLVLTRKKKAEKFILKNVTSSKAFEEVK